MKNTYLDFHLLDGTVSTKYVSSVFEVKFPIDLNKFYEITYLKRSISIKNKVKIKKVKIFAKLVSLSASIKGDICTSRYKFKEIDQCITPKKSLVSYIKVKLTYSK